eukprot:TRINITY_DN83712_c0_g1_i1.p1 TRINITY_DN83712_c0_g1~~TRINITY_DN83712_c0_g1_i1.p1  ORF type:complete len:415 (+),score=83.54 TRINITY_DN83712_c0_g1_i1:223-1467(+)
MGQVSACPSCRCDAPSPADSELQISSAAKVSASAAARETEDVIQISPRIRASPAAPSEPFGEDARPPGTVEGSPAISPSVFPPPPTAAVAQPPPASAAEDVVVDHAPVPAGSDAMDETIFSDYDRLRERVWPPPWGSGEKEPRPQEDFVLETLGMATDDTPPTRADQCAEYGWKDISKATAQVLYKPKTAPPRDCIYIGVQSKEQVKELQLLDFNGTSIRGGAMPTVWAVEHWPLWFPFCESTKVLKRFGPDRFILQLNLKIMFVRLDILLFAAILDKLETDGAIEVIFRSPPTGSEGKEWLGIEVPPKPGWLPRICVQHCQLLIQPSCMRHVRLSMRADVEDVGGMAEWIKVFLFQQIAIRVIPEVAKFQPKIPGSPLDHYLNGGLEKEDSDYMFCLYRRIEEAVSRKSRRDP